MANEKIHEYTDVATLFDIQNNQVMIDTDVQESGTWISKQLNVKDIITASNDQSTRIFGSFHDEGNQIHTLPNVPKAMNISNSDSANGTYLSTDSFGNQTQIGIGQRGIYNLQFSAQLFRTSGGATEQVSIWFRKNGVDIPNSNTHMNVVANSRYLVASWNIFIDCDADDQIQIMWSVTSIAITIPSVAPDLSIPHPATPSLIVTINKI